MEHGTLWGHGAYLGPDYSAEYLDRLSEVTRNSIATEKHGKLFAQLSPDERSVVSARTITVLKENRYDPASRTLRFSPDEVRMVEGDAEIMICGQPHQLQGTRYSQSTSRAISFWIASAVFFPGRTAGIPRRAATGRPVH